MAGNYRTETVRVPGKPGLTCSVTGRGPAVFFLHGVGGRRQNWSSQIDAVADRYTAIAWDARGYGDSDDYDTPLTFSDFGDDLARALDHLNIDNAHLVGLSMGARILLDFFPRFRDRVATLTLCDVFYSYEHALSPAKQEEYIALRERPLREGKTFADLAPRLIESLVSPSCSEPVRAELYESIVALRVDSYLKTIRAATTFDQSSSLEAIDVPVQLIYGAEDTLTPPSVGEEMNAQIPDAQLAVLDGAGHLSNLERPEAFNRVLTAFLDNHASASSA